MDFQLDYSLFDCIHFLCAESRTSAYSNGSQGLAQVSVDIGTEHGRGYQPTTDYIEKADDSALARELCAEGIVLNEEQSKFVEQDSDARDYIRLYLSCCAENGPQKVEQFNLAAKKLNCTFLADNVANSKNELTCSSQRIQNLYDITDVSIKKLGAKEWRNSNIPETDYHHDVFAPAMEVQPLGFCQTNSENDFENDVVLLTDGTRYSPYYMRTSQATTGQFEDGSTTFTTHFETQLEKTYAYQPPCGDDEASQNWDPKISYSGIRRSWILDLPVNQRSSFGGASDIADYDDGVVYAYRMMPTKSTLNPQYTTEMSSQSGLLNCRTYAEVKSVAGKPYLKYYDDTNYQAVGAIASTSALQEVTVKAVNSQTGVADAFTKPYQKIEFIHPVDFRSNAKHKSNLFNVELSGTGIETEYAKADEAGRKETCEKLKKIKFDIVSAIKEIAKNVSPANTQLFDVKFLD